MISIEDLKIDVINYLDMHEDVDDNNQIMEEIEEFADIFKALSDPTRLMLVKLLGDCMPDLCGGGPLCVNALSQRLGVTQSAVSQHLRILKHVGLVRGERHGSFMHYFINPRGVEKCKVGLSQVFGGKLKID
jgi:DNA-binding transcriptional ArsR family regulator